MKKPVTLLAAGLLAAATTTSAMAHSIVFEASLLGANEVPAVASPGTGKATITLDEHAMTMRVQASFEGLIGNVTSAHIHCCTALANSGNSGVASPVPTFPGFPSGIKAGTYDQTFDMSLASSWNNAFINTHGGSVSTAFDALAEGFAQEKAYFNLHTSAFPGGELRGTLVSVVPEPASLVLMSTGLLCLAGAARRRSSASQQGRQG